MNFGFPTEKVKEGKVIILVPRLEAFVKEAWEYAPSKAPVFYNPAMEFNRDLAVLALQAYQRIAQRDLVVCEPLGGCGVRGVRLASEVQGICRVVVNDISHKAAKLADFNVKLNNLEDRVSVGNEDANLLLSRYAAPRKRFDYLDIDPFGSPVPYLDSAVRAVKNGGLIALTATDMAPLCGVHPKAGMRKYGGKPLRTEYCHELAVRLLIGCLASSAARHDSAVNLMFSCSEYNYVRTYATISYNAKQADKCMQNMGYILHCFTCFHRETQKGIISRLKEICPECGSKLQTAGPLWLGSLWNEKFCTNMKDETRRSNLRHKVKIYRMISQISAEAQGPITYYAADKFCDKFNLPTPPLSKIIVELRRSGFEAVATHFNSKAVRTDAPARVLREIVTKLTKISSSEARETNIREGADDYMNEETST